MALKTKAHVPQDAVETVNEEPVVEQKQISFDDIEFEAEFVDEEELETKKFYTISGIPSNSSPTSSSLMFIFSHVGSYCCSLPLMV